MPTDKMKVTAQCENHETPVPVKVANINDDSSKVVCPECGQDFGAWGKVKKALKAKAGKKLQNMLRETMKGTGWTNNF